jgi:glycyl-tRNA synthetase beta chain
MKDKGIRSDVTEAVLSSDTKNLYLNDIQNRIFALEEFLKSENGANLLVAYKRGANILAIEEKKDREKFKGDDVVEDKLQNDAETSLFKVLNHTSEKIAPLFNQKKYSDCMTAIADMRPQVDKFFTDNLVNDPNEDIRINRLRLLAKIRETINPVADFSKLEG